MDGTSRFPRTTGHPRLARGEWWTVPRNATAVYLVLLLPTGWLRGLAVMATDPCYGPGACPATHAHLALADHALLATVCLAALQWPAAYLLPRARVLSALAPAVALVVAVHAILTIEAGT
ncbi:hypothetical protein [Kitasatospora sp. NPDC017646]|uniref:hypothetical protein n=1 Tax=Kitasatospora sp. NPDC017646 TaxID=3364024 RepID=UPI0037906097